MPRRSHNRSRPARSTSRCSPLLGIAQIGLGFIFLTIGARLIPAGEVALITLLEIVLGPLWVWLFLSEGPSAATFTGGMIVLGAVLLQSRGEPPETVI